MKSSAFLSVDRVSVYYGPIKALDDVSFDMHAGEIVTLIGANGAGKTTALRALSGLMKPKTGRMSFLGADIALLQPHEIVRLKLSQAPEGRGIFTNLSVMENLDLGAYSLTARERKSFYRQDLENVFQLFPRLQERLAQNAGTLSGGEQQMLAIGRALMARPKLLLLDEPSLGLAPKMIATIFEIIGHMNRHGMSILLVEQNARLALEVAHRAFVLETGKIVAQGLAGDLLDSPEIKKAYLGG